MDSRGETGAGGESCVPLAATVPALPHMLQVVKETVALVITTSACNTYC